MVSLMSPQSDSILPQRHIYRILAGQVFDSHERKLIPKQTICVDGDTGLILDIRPTDAIAFAPGNRNTSAAVIDEINLSSLTVLPGFVDVHVHLFLHQYSETPWQDQLTRESLAERTIRATVHARKTLLAGFTTVRDLGTEGSFDADLALRKCLSGGNPIVPGPRYYCANRAIITTGAYGPKSSVYPSQDGVDGVTGAEPADGVDACIRAVRRQIGAGADWIKIYADYRVRSRQDDVSPNISGQSIATFNKEELKAMISTSHALGVKVATHAQTPGQISTLLDLGVDSIEHGGEMYMDENCIAKFANTKHTTWVPTLAAFYTTNVGWERSQKSFLEAVTKHGMENIACGGDTGVFSHGNNALELTLMRRLGVEWYRILAWATLGGWKCIRGMEWEGREGERRMQAVERDEFNKETFQGLDRGVPWGSIKKGWAADLIGIEGKLDGSVEEFEHSINQGIVFVMKSGKIYKQHGKATNECFP